MLSIDKIIDTELYHVRNVGRVTSICDEENQEDDIDEVDILLKDN